jgi:hypothetical protein
MPYATGSNCGVTAGLCEAGVCDAHLAKNRQALRLWSPVPAVNFRPDSENAGSIPAATIASPAEV